MSDFAFDALAAVRNKLLDLSGRNPLLNYRHPTAACVRLIDEMPDAIVALLQEGKPLTFIAVPKPTERESHMALNAAVNTSGELQRTLFDDDASAAPGEAVAESDPQKRGLPSAEQWAKHLGMAVDYDLPEAADPEDPQTAPKKHHDSHLQTLLYANDLDARLHHMRGKAEEAIEESGANILYLVVGFLEWFESDDSEKINLAPLFTLPVQMKRSVTAGDSLYKYSIELKDDGLLNNVTLREKLHHDFHLALPDVLGQEGEALNPEAYFELLQQSILRHQPRWKIRRQASLVLLNFAKQVMYQDLDPDAWPADNRIENHPVVQQFFGSGLSGESVSAGYANEHAIDTIDNVHQLFPLIYDADSSQHSALIDAVGNARGGGKSLVIEGPPGSGKSQTITNLIAACIANGQKVLFVAEKMAALNVVKNRLDRAGLGDFCLELHSHKTQKNKIMQDLAARINAQSNYRLPADIDVDIARLENRKTQLNDYVAHINAPWAATALSLHTIFNRATKLHEAYKDKYAALNLTQLSMSGLSGENFTPLRQKELQEVAQTLRDVFLQIAEQAPNGDIRQHYWVGVTQSTFTAEQSQHLMQGLQQWTEQLQSLHAAWQTQTQALHIVAGDTVSISQISHFIEASTRLPELQGGELLAQQALIQADSTGFSAWLNTYKTIHQQLTELSGFFTPTGISSDTTPAILTQAAADSAALGLGEALNLGEVANIQKDAQRLAALATTHSQSMARIRAHIPSALQAVCSSSAHGIDAMLTLLHLIAALPADLWRYRSPEFDSPDMDALLADVNQHLQQLLPLYQKLHTLFDIARLPAAHILKNYQLTLISGGLFKWANSGWRAARKAVLLLAAQTKVNNTTLLDELPHLIQYADALAALNARAQAGPLLGAYFKGVHTDMPRLNALRNWYKAVRAEYGLGFGERIAMGDALLAMDRTLASQLDAALRQDLHQRLQALQAGHLKISRQCSEFLPLHDTHADLASTFIALHNTIKTLLAHLTGVVSNHNARLADLTDRQSRLIAVKEAVTAWQSQAFTQQLVPQAVNLSLHAGSFSDEKFAALQRSLVITQCAAENAILTMALQQVSNASDYQRLQTCAESLKNALQQTLEPRQLFMDAGTINIDLWCATSGDVVQALSLRNQQALQHKDWLPVWLNYLRVKQKLTQQGLDAIAQPLEAMVIDANDLPHLIQLVIFQQLAAEIFQQYPALAQFDGGEQNALRSQFQQYDRDLLQSQRQKVAYQAAQQELPIGNASGKVGTYSEMGLIRHETAKKTRHVPLRSLLQRAHQSVQALKPCFMMSPMSVAQYLPAGLFQFDLVVMDEASQIRPEDALGAIARGTRLVVVGDPKQLPPTAFFSRSIAVEDEDDSVALEAAESILEVVQPMFTTRRLRWHYRSRHASLIAFSNQHFYDNDLILFPSPQQHSAEFGIRFERVTDGACKKGHNPTEAQAMVRYVCQQLLERPQESVGMVAMNVKQSEEIERQLEAELKDNPLLREAYARNQSLDEPLFIKNLENVQGDERDVIVIGMTYGSESVGGHVFQRFGPINSETGWRRLNVLFTRAKKRMQVFSSMGASDVLINATSSKGLRSLHAFLEYAETGHLHNTQHTGKQPDSDFEVAVMDALSKHGFECEPQLGVAGFFLDLAVRDPSQPGRFLMAIECDGATYHSAKSARDRDRLRQEILEGLGWRVRRIWSTDWFKNPQAVLMPIVQELQRLSSSAVPSMRSAAADSHARSRAKSMAAV